MENIWAELGFEAQDWIVTARIGMRLLISVVLGALVGLEREYRRRAAGLRTHMLVALGAALFTVIPVEMGATASELAELVRGIAAGVGFLGAGAILKMSGEGEVKGLTTAAGIWLTAAVGFSVGAGWFAPALLAIVLSLIILTLVKQLEKTQVVPTEVE